MGLVCRGRQGHPSPSSQENFKKIAMSEIICEKPDFFRFIFLSHLLFICNSYQNRINVFPTKSRGW